MWSNQFFLIGQIGPRTDNDNVSKHRNTFPNLKLCIAMGNRTLKRSKLLCVGSFIVFDIQCGHF